MGPSLPSDASNMILELTNGHTLPSLAQDKVKTVMESLNAIKPTFDSQTQAFISATADFMSKNPNCSQTNLTHFLCAHMPNTPNTNVQALTQMLSNLGVYIPTGNPTKNITDPVLASKDAAMYAADNPSDQWAQALATMLNTPNLDQNTVNMIGYMVTQGGSGCSGTTYNFIKKVTNISGSTPVKLTMSEIGELFKALNSDVGIFGDATFTKYVSGINTFLQAHPGSTSTDLSSYIASSFPNTSSHAADALNQLLETSNVFLPATSVQTAMEELQNFLKSMSPSDPNYKWVKALNAALNSLINQPTGQGATLKEIQCVGWMFQQLGFPKSLLEPLEMITNTTQPSPSYFQFYQFDTGQNLTSLAAVFHAVNQGLVGIATPSFRSSLTALINQMESPNPNITQIQAWLNQQLQTSGSAWENNSLYAPIMFSFISTFPSVNLQIKTASQMNAMMQIYCSVYHGISPSITTEIETFINTNPTIDELQSYIQKLIDKSGGEIPDRMLNRIKQITGIGRS
ncbi:MAG: hypothetical protein SP1CHLAM54_14350 [Chlamydiia bacterium]|nr:hypothetical protein [Chlamydiia bacterium]MCH9616327.1 hypothetical protein [Chlamydiia bacterium]MCH9629687.1 hypothetical protein [Chlamydiia bacterium]